MANNYPRRGVEQSQPHIRRSKSNFIVSLAKWINAKVGFDENLSPSLVSKIIWIMFLVVIYIFFQHNFEGLIRKLNKTERQVNAQRAAFISHKANYMFASKQSEIEKKLSNSDIDTNAAPPIKIQIISE